MLLKRTALVLSLPKDQEFIRSGVLRKKYCLKSGNFSETQKKFSSYFAEQVLL